MGRVGLEPTYPKDLIYSQAQLPLCHRPNKQAHQDSDPDRRFWRPMCYRYTMDLLAMLFTCQRFPDQRRRVVGVGFAPTRFQSSAGRSTTNLELPYQTDALRPEWESNPPDRFCRPVPNRSAIGSALSDLGLLIGESLTRTCFRGSTTAKSRPPRSRIAAPQSPQIAMQRSLA